MILSAKVISSNPLKAWQKNMLGTDVPKFSVITIQMHYLPYIDKISSVDAHHSKFFQSVCIS